LLPRRGFLLLGSSGQGRVERPTIIGREVWAEGLKPKKRMRSETPRFLLVHHTADGNGVKAKKKVVGLLRAYYRQHTKVKKWPDIAYNFLIDPAGRIWEGRSGSLDGPVRGDATGGNQGYSQLVCLIGDFTKKQPTKAAYKALVALLAWLADRYGIDVSLGKSITFTSRGSNRWKKGRKVKTYPIAGHRDMSLTACPGNKFYPRIRKNVLPDVRAAVKKARKTTKAKSSAPTAANGGAAIRYSSASASVPMPRPSSRPASVAAAGVIAAFSWVIARRNEVARLSSRDQGTG
jgi:hypothetical protein